VVYMSMQYAQPVMCEARSLTSLIHTEAPANHDQVRLLWNCFLANRPLRKAAAPALREAAFTIAISGGRHGPRVERSAAEIAALC
jgi:hypothetical protein